MAADDDNDRRPAMDITDLRTIFDEHRNPLATTHRIGDNENTIVGVPFSLAELSDMLVVAFEGDIGYWGFRCRYRAPALPADHMAFMSEFDKTPKYGIYPLFEGGAVIMHETEEDEHDNRCTGDDDCPLSALVLDYNAVCRGLMGLAISYPARLADGKEGTNFDAEDGDVFLQMALFGRIVYG